jgi:O-antigen/teichoic acid export membrane protein
MTIFIARNASLQFSGYYITSLAVGAFLGPLCTLGSDRVFVSAHRNARLSGKRSIHFPNLILRFIGTILSIVLALAYCAISERNLSGAFALLTLCIWSNLTGLYPNAWYDLLKKAHIQNYVQVTERMLSIGFVAVILKHPSVEFSTNLEWSIILLLVRIVSIIVQYKLIFPRSAKLWFHWYLLKEDIGISGPFTIVAVANAIVAYGNILVLRETLSPIAYNSYGILFQMLNVIIIYQSQSIRYMIRGIAKNFKSHRSSRLLKSDLMKMFASSVILSAFAFSITPFVLNTAGGNSESLPDLTYVFLYCWVALLGAGQIITQYIASGSSFRVYAITSVTGAFATYAGGILLIPGYGVVAAAGILLVVHGLMITSNTIFLLRRYR